MKLVLLGSTGFLGTAIIEAVLKRSISVTAIARDKKKLNKFNNKIEVYEADYFNLVPIEKKL